MIMCPCAEVTLLYSVFEIVCLETQNMLKFLKQTNKQKKQSCIALSNINPKFTKYVT